MKPAKEKGVITQLDKFKEAARELETDDSEEPLNSAIRKLGKRPSPPKSAKE